MLQDDELVSGATLYTLTLTLTPTPTLTLTPTPTLTLTLYIASVRWDIVVCSVVYRAALIILFVLILTLTKQITKH